MRYKHKPLVIEAFQYDGGLKSDVGYYVPDWAVKSYQDGKLCYVGNTLCLQLAYYRLQIDVGDYIYKDENGAISVSNPIAFLEEYEPAY